MNTYCDALGIDVPSVEKAAQSRDASSYELFDEGGCRVYEPEIQAARLMEAEDHNRRR